MSGVVALLPEAFRSAGGIQRYGRVLAKALAAATPPGGLGLLFLNDRAPDLDARYLGPPLGHLNFAPLVPLVRRLSPGTSVWCLLYGIEEWRPLPARTRRGLGARDLASAMEFRGRFSEAELAQAYRACNLLVLPSRGEGFGRAHAEGSARTARP